MMRECEKALLHILEEQEELLAEPSRILVLGSSSLVRKGMTFYTPYKGDYDSSMRSGGVAFGEESVKKFACVVVAGTKQKEETAGLIAVAFDRVEPRGLVISALENDSGGKGLDRIFDNLGCPADHFSKHKSRVVWTKSPELANKSKVEHYRNEAAPHRRPDGKWTKAGVFSFNKIDQGTALLIEILNKSPRKEFYGKVADFGCGIGDLSNYVLEQNPRVEKLYAIDHDKRAVECAALNLQAFDARTETIWADISSDRLPDKLDFIIMNPPFHQGKKESVDLGQKFIDRAYSSLHTNGELYMVANVHLPYEEKLKGLFTEVEQLGVKGGFKIIRAKKA